MWCTSWGLIDILTAATDTNDTILGLETRYMAIQTTNHVYIQTIVKKIGSHPQFSVPFKFSFSFLHLSPYMEKGIR